MNKWNHTKDTCPSKWLAYLGNKICYNIEHLWKHRKITLFLTLNNQVRTRELEIIGHDIDNILPSTLQRITPPRLLPYSSQDDPQILKTND